MQTRRDFLKKGLVLGAGFCLPLSMTRESRAEYPDMKTRDPKRAVVLWYSQTGHTRRYARLIGCTLQGKGLSVEVRDMQEFDRKLLPDYDLVVAGVPVYYYDVPSNIVEWLEGIPSIKGTLIAAYVSFGGPDGNQYNASSHLAKLLADKGGVPVGRDAFRNVATYPVTWDSSKQKSGEHLPNEETFDQVRRFTAGFMEKIGRGETISVGYRLASRELLRIMPLIWMNKKGINLHAIDASKCIGCQTCVKKCPTKAINPTLKKVDQDKCLACFGCLNNCSAGAVMMEYTGKRLYGFPEYLKRNKITVREPAEFKTCRL